MEILIILITLGVSGIVIAIYLAQRLDKAAIVKTQTSEGRKELVETAEKLFPKQVDFGVGTGFKFGFGFALGVSLALLIMGLISTIIFASFVQTILESAWN